MNSFNCAMSKLLLDENEDDVIKIQFPNEDKKIKCSISILSEVSPIFKAMFSKIWCQHELDESTKQNITEFAHGGKEKIVKLVDSVDFDQYQTFKSFMEIVYGLRQIDSIQQATDVYYYAHKYQVVDVENKIQKILCERMNHNVSVDDIEEVITFLHVYQPGELIQMLDQIKPKLNEDIALKFFELAIQFKMNVLKKKVISFIAKLAPKDNWPVELYRSLTIHFQNVLKDKMERIENVGDAISEFEYHQISSDDPDDEQVFEFRALI